MEKKLTHYIHSEIFASANSFLNQNFISFSYKAHLLEIFQLKLKIKI